MAHDELRQHTKHMHGHGTARGALPVLNWLACSGPVDDGGLSFRSTDWNFVGEGPWSRAGPAQPPRLLDRVRTLLRARRYDPQASHVPHLQTFLRNPSAGGGLWHPHPPRTPRASRRQYDDDLHARTEPRTGRRAEPSRPPGAPRKRRRPRGASWNPQTDGAGERIRDREPGSRATQTAVPRSAPARGRKGLEPAGSGLQPSSAEDSVTRYVASSPATRNRPIIVSQE
jgi:hypothetical protein